MEEIRGSVDCFGELFHQGGISGAMYSNKIACLLSEL